MVSYTQQHYHTRVHDTSRMQESQLYMTKLDKTVPEHKDKLGRVIRLEDFVCYPDGNSLEIGKVVKINPKMIKVSRIPDRNRKWGGEKNKYPVDAVLVEAKAATFYILKNSS